MSLLAFCEWLAATNGSIALHESLYMYPLVESVHVLTLCVFVGLAIVLDLRLLGLAFTGSRVSEVAKVLPWTIGGFVIMVITGELPAKAAAPEKISTNAENATQSRRSRTRSRKNRNSTRSETSRTLITF